MTQEQCYIDSFDKKNHFPVPTQYEHMLSKYASFSDMIAAIPSYHPSSSLWTSPLSV